MDNLDVTIRVAGALRAEQFGKLADAVHIARIRINGESQIFDIFRSTCGSILFHCEKYLRCISRNQENEVADIESDRDKPFFEVWYSLEAFGLCNEDLDSAGVM